MEGDDYKPTKKSNVLPAWGNEKTMNLNSMVLTNILASPYFKNQLYQLKTYHEVVDEIYYKVEHLEPWEKGSRKTSGQVGMCGGVRGVGAGGIVSTAFCLLYKLYTLKLTRKQLNGLITHGDSPFIRGLGFMYIRYTQPPPDLWGWYADFLEDEEEFDPKAGSGCTMTMGQLVRSFLLKLEWYGTLFPRIPVPVQKDIEKRLRDLGLCDDHKRTAKEGWGEAEDYARQSRGDSSSKDPVGNARERRRDSPSPHRRSRSADRSSRSRRSRSRDRQDRSDRERRRSRSRDWSRRRSNERHSRSQERRHGDSEKDRSRAKHKSRSPRRRDKDRENGRKRSRSTERGKHRHGHSRDRDSKSHHRDRSRSR